MKKYLFILLMLLPMTGSRLLAADFETAQQAVKNMKVGWNLGNTLDSSSGTTSTNWQDWETVWGQPITKPELMTMMRDAGFGAIRVPVTWYHHMDSNGKVDASWMHRVHEVVDYVLSTGMYCIVNVHHDTGENGWLFADETVYANQKARYEYLWQQIAEEFKDYDERLLFESYNEMLDSDKSWCFASFNSTNRYDATKAKSAYSAINKYAQSFVTTVRATGGNNAQRNLVVNTYAACSGSGNWNSHLTDPLSEMNLPTDNVANHIIFQVHTYLDISNISNTKNEINDMISKLKKYLVAKGAPVIFGEWGTSNVDSNRPDYDYNRANMLSFARYFVEQCKANDIGTFYWMGLSNGVYRSYPAFSQPDLAEAILQGYYGSNYQVALPTEDDFDVVYVVDYSGQWQELNLCNKEISPSQYKGIKLELKDVPAAGLLSIKVYSAKNSSGHYFDVSSTSTTTTVNFNASVMGNSISRVTLQYSKTTAFQTKVSKVTLLKADGTEEVMTPDVFWGCKVSVEATKKPTGVSGVMAERPADGQFYTLSGQRVAVPGRGIYIVNGRKVVIR